MTYMSERASGHDDCTSIPARAAGSHGVPRNPNPKRFPIRLVAAIAAIVVLGCAVILGATLWQGGGHASAAGMDRGVLRIEQHYSEIDAGELQQAVTSFIQKALAEIKRLRIVILQRWYRELCAI